MVSLFGGFNKIKTIVYVIVIVGVSVLWILNVRHEQARSRDIQRIADVLIIENAFEQMFQHDRSYSVAAYNGCDEEGMSIRRCQLRDYYLDINTMRDPGGFDYTITKVPTETSYEVSFWLEIDHEDFSKGKHVITPEGIN